LIKDAPILLSAMELSAAFSLEMRESAPGRETGIFPASLPLLALKEMVG